MIKRTGCTWRQWALGATYFGALLAVGLASAPACAGTFVFTNDAQWNTGIYTSTNSGPPGTDNQVQLDPDIVTPFDHIWVAASDRGTVIRVDTDTGVIRGEYRTAPQGQATNPSRTTVDKNGDVWVGNRDQGTGGLGSAVKISASATGPNTSTGLGDIRPWTNAGGADTNGGTSTAADDAILLYLRTTGNFVRHVSVDKDNNVWVGGASPSVNGAGNQAFQLYNGTTGAAIPSSPGNFTSFDINRGGYGGLVDGNGVVWGAGLGANTMVRFDPATGVATPVNNGRQSYGMGIDNNGKIWVANWTDQSVQRLNGTTGAVEGTFFPGRDQLRGVAVTPADNDVWVASSNSSQVVRLNNDGTVQSFVNVGGTPTGVAVDKHGKVWVTNYSGHSLMRIDPAANGGNGAVDMTVNLGAGAGPYNYSDMTGTVLLGTTIRTGTWVRLIDGGVGNPDWDQIFWNQEPEGFEGTGTDIRIDVRGADTLADLALEPYTEVLLSGDALSAFDGLRYLQVRATLTGALVNGAKISPILSDLMLTTVDQNGAPEPGTLALLGVALISLAGLRRRRH